MVAQHTMGSRRQASGMPWLSDSLQPEKRHSTHLASFPGHSQILSRSCGENLGFLHSTPGNEASTHTGLAQWLQKCSDLGRMPTSFDGK